MSTTLSAECGFFLACIIAGIAVSFLYDVLRVSRRLLGPGDAAVTIEDLLFMAASAILLFRAAYLKNDGEIRWHSFLGSAIGVFLYIFIVRNRFLNLSTFLIKWFIKLLEKILQIIIFPIRLVFMTFKRPISVIIWYTGRGLRRARQLASRKRYRIQICLKNVGFMLRKK